MNIRSLLYAPLLAAFIAAPVFAQTAPTTGPSAVPPAANADRNAYQRDLNQQNRIEQGLQSGQLSTGEASRLEKGESRIDQMESHDEKTGMTPAEMQRLQNAQNAESRAITRDDNNSIHGNPNSASSQRMQNDVQRDINQQGRINQGIQNGSLTAGEAGRLEHGQAKDDHAQYRAGRNGNVSAREQARLERRENRQSNRIHREKHNNHTANTNQMTP